MSEQHSPTTEGATRASWPTTPISTYGGRRAAPQTQRAAPATPEIFATVPENGEQCDQLLDAAATRLRQHVLSSSDYVAFARHLGASNRVWTPPRRLRLREIVSSAGAVVGTTAVTRAVAELPREEVIDDALAVLKVMAERNDEVMTLAIHTLMPALAASLGQPSPIAAESDAVRALLVRLLGGCKLLQSRYGLAPLSFALEDASPHVRDAAIQALTATGGKLARGILQRQRTRESEAFLRDQIDAALEEIAT
jgi:hypothetical protein